LNIENFTDYGAWRTRNEKKKKCGTVDVKRKCSLEGVDTKGNITLIWILDKYKVKYGLRIRSIAGFCDDGDGLQGSIKI
jgi:endonuclease I